MIDLHPIWLTLKVATLATGLAMTCGVVSTFASNISPNPW